MGPCERATIVSAAATRREGSGGSLTGAFDALRVLDAAGPPTPRKRRRGLASWRPCSMDLEMRRATGGALPAGRAEGASGAVMGALGGRAGAHVVPGTRSAHLIVGGRRGTAGA